MTDDLWQRVQELFVQAADRPPDERAKLLAEACGDDADLRAEVESLLESDSRVTDDFLRPAEPPPGIRHAESAAGPDPLVGTQVGKYQIKGVIAVGGMGTVYEAVQEQPNRVVALKVMRRNVGSRSALRRFQFESQVLARLRHPNIAQVYEAGMHGEREGIHGPAATPEGVPYFAMEYIPDARTIVQYASENTLATRERLRLFAKVCDAIHHGHQKGIIHRDVKPANILVDSPGEPKVIDFGVARATDSDVATTTMQTDVGQLIGTMQYMSPEQCDADPHEIDTRSDVYSLGVVLYELLTGALPYDASGSTIVQAAQIIKEHAPEPLSRVNPKLRGDVETIVLKALQKDRQDRYQSAAELARDICRYLNREPIEARPPTAWTRTIRWVMRNPAASVAVLSVVLVVCSVGTTSAFMWYTWSRADYIQIGGGGREARLLTATGWRLHTWLSNEPNGFYLAELVPRPDELGGGRLAILCYFDTDTGRRVLRAFNIEHSLTEVEWEAQLTPGQVVSDPLAHGYAPDQFAVELCAVEDVFPKRPGEEIIVTHNHTIYSPCAIRVYDLRGDVLYQVWHDGLLAECYWMERARQLVFLGHNSEVPWEERGYSGIKTPHPTVVFALKPKTDVMARGFLRSEPGEGSLHPAWYKCLFPPEVVGDFDKGFYAALAPPAFGSPGKAVSLKLISRVVPQAGLGWDVNEFGEELANSRGTSDLYKANLRQYPQGHPERFPDPGDFQLRSLPPIVSP